MFGVVGYVLLCFAVACVATVGVAMFRPIKQNDDWQAWKWIAGGMLVIGVVPYTYIELMTARFGGPLKPGVQEAVREADLKGDLVYYKVVRADDSKAHVIAVANDQNEFGWPERVVLEIDLLRDKRGWGADAYTIVNSFHRQRDASTLPPYW